MNLVLPYNKSIKSHITPFESSGRPNRTSDVHAGIIFFLVYMNLVLPYNKSMKSHITPYLKAVDVLSGRLTSMQGGKMDDSASGSSGHPRPEVRDVLAGFHHPSDVHVHPVGAANELLQQKICYPFATRKLLL